MLATIVYWWIWLDGRKTYLAAAGLGVLGLYQLTLGHDPIAAWHSFSSALGFLGLRHAIARQGG